MSRSLVSEQPKVVVFYSHWTGLFLQFMRRFVGLRAGLIWEWYDLSTRLGHYRRKARIVGRIMIRLEELTAPRYFDRLIVPTEFARQLLQKWGHSDSKIHVLGEIRELNRYVSLETMEKRIEDVRKGRLLKIVWVGVVRDYQLEGLTQFLHALSLGRSAKHEMVIHIVGPQEAAADALATLVRCLPSEISVQRHGLMSSDALDRLLAQAHAAVHPLPDELFCSFVYSRKMADYQAASLPVAFSAVQGLMEVGKGCGVPFHLGDSESIRAALASLSNPERYREFHLRAWEVASKAYSDSGLQKKSQALIEFLSPLAERATLQIVAS